MRRSRLRAVLVVLAAMALLATACGGDEGDGVQQEQDLLANVQSEGVLRVSTDPAYPPQSSLNEDTGEYEGFDIDVATEIAERLGVEVAWETPQWETIIAGNWNGRWDVSVGSMTITPERAEVLNFTPAYYFTPAAVAVQEDDNSVSDLTTDLDGKSIGVCGGCTYDFYLQKTLDIPGYTPEFVIDDAEIVGTDTDTTAIEQLVQGRVDAAISALPTLQGAIDKGKPIKIVGDPVFYEPLAVAVDKSSDLDPTSFVDRLTEIIEEMHADGTLTELSMKWYGVDLTQQV
ncbi:MAG: transporter substrate-binding domain-containing protein [Actinomycetota bacterium]